MASSARPEYGGAAKVSISPLIRLIEVAAALGLAAHGPGPALIDTIVREVSVAYISSTIFGGRIQLVAGLRKRYWLSRRQYGQGSDERTSMRSHIKTASSMSLSHNEHHMVSTARRATQRSRNRVRRASAVRTSSAKRFVHEQTDGKLVTMARVKPTRCRMPPRAPVDMPTGSRQDRHKRWMAHCAAPARFVPCEVLARRGPPRHSRGR